jgi:hypothetical protein
MVMSRRIRFSRRHDYRPIPPGREHPVSPLGEHASESDRAAATAERLAALDPLGDAAEEAD